MQRRTAGVLGAIVAIVMLGVVVLLSGLLAAEQRAERVAYRDAMLQQRRQAGRAPARDPGAGAGARAPLELCVRGVDGFAASLRSALPEVGVPSVLDDTGRLDLRAFVSLSDLALRAERYVEQARGAPALPQRLGRVRGVALEGEGEDQKTVWRALVPERVPCGEGGAYAVVPLEVEAPVARGDANPPSPSVRLAR